MTHFGQNISNGIACFIPSFFCIKTNVNKTMTFSAKTNLVTRNHSLSNENANVFSYRIDLVACCH